MKNLGHKASPNIIRISDSGKVSLLLSRTRSTWSNDTYVLDPFYSEYWLHICKERQPKSIVLVRVVGQTDINGDQSRRYK